MARAASDRRFQFFRTETTATAPPAADLERGEIALNLFDKTIYTKDQTDSVVILNPKTQIINNLTTGGVTSALSAQQGVALKGLIDGLGSIHTAADITARDALVTGGTVTDLDVVHVLDDGDTKWARYQRVSGAWVKVSDEDALAAGLGATNLDVTASPTNVVVTNTSGSDGTIALVDGTNAGVMSPGDKTKLDAYPATPLNTHIDQTDTPATYTAEAFVMVNAAGTGIDHVTTLDGGTF